MEADYSVSPKVYNILNYDDMINRFPYVYAALGMYEKALSKIRRLRSARIRIIHENYNQGYLSKQLLDEELQAEYLRDAEIEKAMADNDVESCEKILDAIYRRNCLIVQELLKLNFPCPAEPSLVL